MTTLEDQLRESLRAYAARPKLPADVADQAIGGARAVRRRRTLIATGVAVVAAIAAIGGITLGRPTAPATQPGSPTPSASAASSTQLYGVGLDVLEPGDVLRTTDGHIYQLGPDITGLVRIPAGWMYTDNLGYPTLLRPDGTTIPLSGVQVEPTGIGPGVPVPSADGQRIAWVIADHLHTGRVSGTGVVDEHMTPVAPHSFAATWIGDRVVVGMVNANAGGGGVSPADYDIWDPTGGDFVAHWTQGLADVYGPTPPGTAAYANVQKGTTTAGCLGRLDGVADLSVREKVCLPGLLYGSPGGSLAPNGAHLVVFDQTTSSFMIIDVSTVAQTRVATGHCGANLAIAWQDNTYLIAWNTSTQELVHCDVETGVTTRAVGTSTTPFDPNRYRIVPRYGP